MKHLQLFEEFGQSMMGTEAPQSIQVELTDKFFRDQDVQGGSEGRIRMSPEMYYNLGSTKFGLSGETNFYFATYNPEAGGINVFYYAVPPGPESAELFQFLSDAKMLSSRAAEDRMKKFIDSGDLRKVPAFYSGFENGLEPGEMDGRGYFRIIG